VNTGGAGAFHDFSGDAVFAGASAGAARALAAAGPLRGKVIVLLGGLGSDATTLVPEWIRAGVAGVVLLEPDASGFALYVRSRGDSRFYVDAPVDDPVWQPNLPVLLAGPELTRALVAGTAIPDSVARGKPLAAAIPLGRALAATIRVSVAAVRSANVAGLVPGRDPALRDQVVVYTAHYDHLGISTPDARGDSIYNGFSDNAAGDGMLLAIAEALLKDRPARSVLFLFPTGEERGLLGSAWFTRHPTVPREQMIADLNLDQLLPAYPVGELVLRGAELSSLEDHVRAAARELGLAIVPDPVPEQNFFARSDQLEFARIGVPSACLWQGFSGPRGEAAFKDFRSHRYHQPSDEWSAAWDWEAAAQMARAELLVGVSLLTGPRPEWKPDAPFR